MAAWSRLPLHIIAAAVLRFHGQSLTPQVCSPCNAVKNHLRSVHCPGAGFVSSIDCGIPEASSYVDGATKLPYVSDAVFTDDAGANHNISAEYINPSFSKRYLNVRSFPGPAPPSCYTLGSLAPGSKYLFRATFMYGNYDVRKKTNPVYI
ncbi:unnamed protein product [Urochloa humidicola]